MPWRTGGLTDLPNLILLCQWHHTCVHEGGMTMVRLPHTQYDDERLADTLSAQRGYQVRRHQLAAVDRFNHPGRPHHPPRLDRRTVQHP